MLTEQQRQELEEIGPQGVRMKITAYAGGHTGRGSSIGGFKCGDITRGDIDDWLIEKTRSEAKDQFKILLWARIAGVAGIAGVVVALLALYFQAKSGH